MDFVNLYAALGDEWLLRKASFTKEDLTRLSNKDTFRGKMFGFLTREYYQRTKLIRESDLFFAFVFQEWSNNVQGEELRHPTWLLFSPSLEVNKNPTILKDVAEKIRGLKDVAKPITKAEKQLKKLLVEPLSDVEYFEIPEPYASGHLVYLSIVYIEKRLVPSFKLGLNLIMASQQASKEVIYLPEDYWNKDYREAYQNGGLAL